MVTVNRTVCHLQEALIFLGQIEFNANFVNKTSSVSLQHCRIQYSVCVTSVPHKHYVMSYQIIMHLFEESVETICSKVHI